MSKSKYETENFIAFHRALENLLSVMIENEQPYGSAEFNTDGDFSARIDITFNFDKGDK